MGDGRFQLRQCRSHLTECFTICNMFRHPVTQWSFHPTHATASVSTMELVHRLDLGSVGRCSTGDMETLEVRRMILRSAA